MTDVQPLTTSDKAFLGVGTLSLVAYALWALHAFVTRRKDYGLWT